MTLEGPVEDTLHRRNIYDPRRSRSFHLLLELTDEVEGDDRVDDLRSIAIQERYIFNGLHPTILSSLICRLTKLIQLCEIYFFGADGNLVGSDTGEGAVIFRSDDGNGVILFVVLYHESCVL